MTRTCLYFIEPKSDRWFKGDHKIRAPVRRALRGPDPIGGIKKVFLNLCLGLDRLRLPYEVNIPFSELKPRDRVGIIGQGVESLVGYNAQNPVLAGVGINEHPLQIPDLFERYPISQTLVHSDWVKVMYERYYPGRVKLWQVGIDTETWTPAPGSDKTVDFLIYDKVRWNHDQICGSMIGPIVQTLEEKGLTTDTIRYGNYRPAEFREKLKKARYLLFLCEHETQGLAYQEALASGLAVLAWDQGNWLDPMRFHYGEPILPATSVPFFDERCGRTFSSLIDFGLVLDDFLAAAEAGEFAPRDYIFENLSLEKCAEDYVSLLALANG